MNANSCNKTRVGFAIHENNLIYKKGVLEQLVLMSLFYITRTPSCVTLTRIGTAIIAVDCSAVIIIRLCVVYMEKVSKVVLMKVLRMSSNSCPLCCSVSIEICNRLVHSRSTSTPFLRVPHYKNTHQTIRHKTLSCSVCIIYSMNRLLSRYSFLCSVYCIRLTFPTIHQAQYVVRVKTPNKTREGF